VSQSAVAPDAHRCYRETRFAKLNYAVGGWGPPATLHDGEPIPDRSVYIYNNLLVNPAGY